MKKANAGFVKLFICACISGIILAMIDTSKNWDDTAITVGLILITSFVFGALQPKFAWLWALIIGGSILMFNIVHNHNYASAAALVFAFAGAYSGVMFKKIHLRCHIIIDGIAETYIN